jgi:hypothetical protein
LPSDRQRDRRLLERQLVQGVYLEHLAWLRARCAELNESVTWVDAATQLGTPVPDRALRPILHAARAGSREEWNRILLLLFWPTLEAIYWTRRRWSDGEEEEFWADVQASFCQAIARVDPELRPTRIAQKIFGDTVRGTYLIRRRAWETPRRELLVRRDALRTRLKDPGMRVEVENSDWRCDCEFRRRLYLRLARRHVITPDDYLLLCGARALGWTIRTCAARLGLTPEAAKKRLQRVEERIRPFDPLFSETLSPSRCVGCP